jgi:hypothetical protein
MSNLRQTRVLLYRLKRLFGKPLVLKNTTSATQNLETGVITPTYVTVSIARAIVLSASQKKDFAYDLSYIAANKNFTYGAFFTTKERLIIIEQRDLPTSFRVTVHTFCVFDGRRWDVKDSDRGEDGSYLIIVKEVGNSATET